MNLLKKYCKTDFKDFNEFEREFKIEVPENFNFSYDVVDEYAKIAPQKRAIVWCNDSGNEVVVTFAELKEKSDRIACMLYKSGIRKNDAVMMVLKRRLEFWLCIVALHKIGAIAIPATHMLRKNDYLYRINAAN